MSTIYEDSTTITTPDGLTVEVRLAGLGSRFASDLLDSVIKFLAILAMYGLTLVTGFGGAAFAIGAFVVYFGYDVFFETVFDGRTPGKRSQGTRVVRSGGQSIGFVASAIRNVLRLIDVLPAFYGVGGVAILQSKNNQRVGDMAAGTLVIRERIGDVVSTSATAPTSATWRAPLLDVGAVTSDEWEAVNAFLRRRDSLSADVRARIAAALAEHLRSKVPGSFDLADEPLLERVRMEGQG
jgi:uncharacterized RDD family membrane protein YckC